MTPVVSAATAGGEHAVASDHRFQRLGVIGAVLVLLAFGLFNAVAIRPFYAGDESAHTNYALEVASGRLPTFFDRFSPRIPGMADTPTWTAVHGPLYYLLVGPMLRVGIAVGHPVGGLQVARVATVLLAAGTVVLVARLAAALLPDRPPVAVASAGLIALTTSFQQVSAFVYNDALSILATTATLLLIVRALREGCDRRLTLLLALTATVGAATRASGLAVAALAALAAGRPPTATRWRPWRRWLPAALARMAFVAAAVTAAVGWFYLRNVRLYGDPDGSGVAVRGRPPGPSVLHNALSVRFWLDEYGQLWGYVTGEDRVAGWLAGLAFALLAAVLIGLGLALVGWLRADRRGGRVSGRSRLDLAWLAMVGHLALVAGTVLVYFQRGAIPFVRYFFPALPLLAVIAAMGLAALPGRRRGLPTVAALLAATGVGVAMTGVVVAGMTRSFASAGLVGRLTGALAAASGTRPGLVLAGLAGLLGIGLTLMAIAVLRLSGTSPGPDRVSAPAARFSGDYELTR